MRDLKGELRERSSMSGASYVRSGRSWNLLSGFRDCLNAKGLDDSVWLFCEEDSFS